MSKKQLRNWSNNCAKLADFLETVPDQLHDQGSFVEAVKYDDGDHLILSRREEKELIKAARKFDVVHACNTTACAMGWAALSSQFKGLRYDYKSDSPVLNGRITDWDLAGLPYFGERAYKEVFYTFGDKEQTVDHLRELAADYCREAGASHD